MAVGNVICAKAAGSVQGSYQPSISGDASYSSFVRCVGCRAFFG